MILLSLFIACSPASIPTDTAPVESVCHGYRDADGDGFGDPDGGVNGSCDALPADSVQNHDDCDDGDPEVNPDAPEVCNAVDDDCDGQVDEGLSQVWYADGDGDDFGVEETAFEGCDPQDGAVDQAGDCDDDDPATFPGADELCDGRDNDCDGVADSGILGSSSICAAPSCLDLLLERPDLPSGVYPITAAPDMVLDLPIIVGQDLARRLLGAW